VCVCVNVGDVCECVCCGWRLGGRGCCGERACVCVCVCVMCVNVCAVAGGWVVGGCYGDHVVHSHTNACT